MAKMKSSLTNMLLSLTIITVVAAGLLAGVYTMTKDTIEATNKRNIAEAKAKVFTGMENVVVAEEGMAINNAIVYPAQLGDEMIGAAVEMTAASFKGNSTFGGEVKIMFGISTQGEVTGFKVLNQQETPGLGAKMGDWFKDRITGKNPTQLEIVKKGGVVENAANQPLDAITAATITSKAFLGAAQEACEAYFAMAGGATVVAEEEALHLEELVEEEENVEPVNEEE